MSPQRDPARTLVIVGGGFAGTVLALKAARARPRDRVVLVERRRRGGAGLAYGACAPGHLLNVPVSRMESGLEPGFATWLEGCGADLGEALTESGGVLADAFAPRALFGRYMEARLSEAVSRDPRRGLARVVGAAVRMLDAPRRGVVLEDGRVVEGDAVVLATGNLGPHPGPVRPLAGLGDAAELVSDPWAEPWDAEALDGLDPDAQVLLVGAGLTMVDVALRLAWTGRRGPMIAVSRRGLAPQRHAPGGAWSGFLAAAAPTSPLAALQLLRREAAAAQAAGVPWQRVFDAARPDVARTWRGWSLAARRSFLRHGRALWDTHRHRMAPRVADALDALRRDGRLTLAAGRVDGAERGADGLRVRLRLRGGGERWVGPVARVFNCTGPRSDYAAVEAPLFADLRRAGLAQGDGLGLGLVTRDCAVIGAGGEPSDWLYAIGALTRPALWEITAAPEINAQVDALVARMSARATSPLHLAFADLGAGI